MINERDQNNAAVASGVSSVDNVTPTSFRVDPVTDYLLVDMATDSLTATIATKDKRDENDVPTVYGISSVDGITLVPIRTNSSGVLLVQFT